MTKKVTLTDVVNIRSMDNGYKVFPQFSFIPLAGCKPVITCYLRITEDHSATVKDSR